MVRLSTPFQTLRLWAGLLSVSALLSCKFDPDAFRDNLAQNEEGTSFSWSEGFHRLELEASGEVLLSDDGTDVISLEEEGALTVTESDGPFVRTLRFTKTSSGSIRPELIRDGRPTAWDEETLQWRKDVLRRVLQKTGFRARERADRLLQRDGPDALLDEVERLETALVKAVYLQTLLETVEVKGRLRQRALDQTGRIGRAKPFIDTVESAAGQAPQDPSFTHDLVDLIVRTGHSTTRHTLLSRLPDRRPLQTDAWVRLFEAHTHVPSDWQKADSLIQLSGKAPLDDDTVASSFAAAAQSIDSTSSRARLIRHLISRARERADDAVLAARLCASVRSRWLLLDLLSELGAALPDDSGATRAFLESVGTLQPQHQYQVLQPLLSEPKSRTQLEEVLGFVLASVQPGAVRDKLETEVRALLATTG